MFKQYSVLSSLIVLWLWRVELCASDRDTSVCTRMKTTRVMKIEKRVETYIATRYAVCTRMEDDYYRDSYDYEYDTSGPQTYSCLKTMINSRIITFNEPQTDIRTEYYCCPGYTNGDTLNLTYSNPHDVKCLPECDPPCDNGVCAAPQHCICLPGYRSSVKTCEPVCALDCGHGTCIEPDTCECDPGYELTNTTNHSVCTEIGRNGTECSTGYTEINGTCTPKCSNGCVNGECVLPEVCQCDPGFLLTEGDESNGNVCKRVCVSGFKNIEDKCRPVCKQPCGNGTCIGPNHCKCLQGYMIDLNKLISPTIDNSSLCIPVCKHCEGHCVAPNKCILTTTVLPLSSYKSDRADVVKSFNTTVPWMTTSQLRTTRVSSTSLTTPRLTISSTSTNNEYDANTLLSNSWSVTPSSIPSTAPSTTNRLTSSRSATPKSSRSTTSQLNSAKYDEIEKKINTDENYVTTVDGNAVTTLRPSNNSATLQTSDKMTWMEKHWASVFLPVLLVVFAVIVMLIVWRRSPFFVHLRGRSYVVKDNGSRECTCEQEIHFSTKKDHVEYK